MCGIYVERGCCYHHLLTRKSYPEYENEPWNKVSLCLADHNRIHSASLSGLTEGNFRLKKWLLDNGWEYDCYFEKWRYPWILRSGSHLSIE